MTTPKPAIEKPFADGTFCQLRVPRASDVATGTPIEWRFLALLAALSVAGVLVGARLGARISGARLKRSFGALVLVVAVFILVKELVVP